MGAEVPGGRAGKRGPQALKKPGVALQPPGAGTFKPSAGLCQWPCVHAGGGVSPLSPSQRSLFSQLLLCCPQNTVPQGRAKGGWWQNGVPLVSTWAPCLLLTAPALQTPQKHQLLFWALLCPQLRAPRCGRQAPFFIFKAFCFKGVLEGLTLTSWDPGVFVLHSLGTGSGQLELSGVQVVGAGGGWW